MPSATGLPSSAYPSNANSAGKFIRHVDTWDAIKNQSFPSVEGFAHMLSQVFDLRRTPPELESPPYQLLLKRAKYSRAWVQSVLVS